MKSCHLSSAYPAPDTTPNTFPARLLWCLDNVVKRAALSSSQSGKQRGAELKSLFQSFGHSKWPSWDVNQSFSGSKSLLFETKTCFSWKSTRDLLWQNFASHENSSQQKSAGLMGKRLRDEQEGLPHQAHTVGRERRDSHEGSLNYFPWHL